MLQSNIVLFVDRCCDKDLYSYVPCDRLVTFYMRWNLSYLIWIRIIYSVYVCEIEKERDCLEEPNICTIYNGATCKYMHGISKTTSANTSPMTPLSNRNLNTLTFKILSTVFMSATIYCNKIIKLNWPEHWCII